MSEHVHNFQLHAGIRIVGRRFIAWVRAEGNLPEGVPQMQRCIKCGEQGYEIPDAR